MTNHPNHLWGDLWGFEVINHKLQTGEAVALGKLTADGVVPIAAKPQGSLIRLDRVSAQYEGADSPEAVWIYRATIACLNPRQRASFASSELQRIQRRSGTNLIDVDKSELQSELLQSSLVLGRRVTHP
ncbi:MAG TPA: hypothetical protein VIV60_00025 [Polyangiaceae bacterium]